MKELTEQEAYQRLASLCARAEHCEQDLLDKMRRWGLADSQQALVMGRLVEGRYVDNRRYAEAFVRDKVRYSKWGPRKIEQALWQKRIDDDTIGEALDAIDPDEYTAILKPILQQKRRTTTAKSPYELQQKLVRYALGRGFTFEQIRRCLDLGECEDCETD